MNSKQRFVAQLLILLYVVVGAIAFCDHLDKKNWEETIQYNKIQNRIKQADTILTYSNESRPEKNETVLYFSIDRCGCDWIPYSNVVTEYVECPIEPIFDNDDIETNDCTFETLPLPYGDCSSFMFMDYRALTDISSKQWELQQYAYDGNYGIRMVDGCYCVATSSMYGDVGDKIRVTTDRGNTYWCIIADIKGYDSVGGWYHVNSQGAINLIEFVVDSDYIPNECWQMGDMGVIDDIGGDVIAVER